MRFILTILLVTIGTLDSRASAPMLVHAECEPSPPRDLLPGVIAPMAGESPIWFVDGSFGQWQGPTTPVKSAWVLARDTAGVFQARGHQVDGPGSLTFRRGMNGPVESSLLIRAPLAETMIPGGASDDVMRKFTFVSSYVFYSHPGCWELDVQLGDRRHKVVVLVR